MKKIIESINVVSNNSFGLSPDSKLERFGDVVIFTGKNGSGKTRILKYIQESIKKAHDNEYDADGLRAKNNKLDELESIINKNRQEINSMEEEGNEKLISVLEQKKRKLELDTQERSKILREVHSIEDSKRIRNFPGIDVSKIDVIYFIPSKIDGEFQSSEDLCFKERREIGEKGIGLRDITDNFSRVLKIVLAIAVDAKHEDADNKNRSIFKRLQDACSALLGFRLGYNYRLGCTLNDNPIDTIFKNMSNGQKYLLYICAIICRDVDQTSDVVLLLDEPELHLHSGAIIDLFDQIKKLVPNGQIFVATHSLALISHIGSDHVWMCDEGVVSYAGSRPDTYLNALLGADARIDALNHLTTEPFQRAAVRFAAESLLPPVTVGGRGDGTDSQASLLHRVFDLNGKKILDYGSGQGRLFLELDAIVKDTSRKNPGKSSISFEIYEYDVGHDSALREIVSNGNIRRFSINDIKNNYTQLECINVKFDIIVMCNVLHEIDHKEWFKIFMNVIPKISNKKCQIVIIEDAILRHGEFANENGFIMHTQSSLDILFNQGQFSRFERSTMKGYEDRIYLYSYEIRPYPIERDKFEKIKIKSINAILLDSIANIKAIRGKTNAGVRSKEDHRRMAFFLVQYANASLLLAELKGAAGN